MNRLLNMFEQCTTHKFMCDDMNSFVTSGLHIMHIEMMNVLVALRCFKEE